VAALRDMLGDAVFLDEEAFAGAATMQLYQQRLQVSTPIWAMGAREERAMLGAKNRPMPRQVGATALLNTCSCCSCGPRGLVGRGGQPGATVAAVLFLPQFQERVGWGFLKLFSYAHAQAQVRRMRELEAVAEALRAEVSMKDEALAAARDSVEAANTRVRDMQGELDANAAVFELREWRPPGWGHACAAVYLQQGTTGCVGGAAVTS
jgi:hypothetical protein